MPPTYEVLPIPSISAHTRRFEAGAVTIGVEYRLLNEAIIAEEYGENSREQFGGVMPESLPAVVEEDGVSVHVFSARDGGEWLRFDCFGDYPHYHYISPEEGRQTVIEFDTAAEGPMVPWVLTRLRSQLPEMLRRAGGEKVAEAVDPQAVAAVLDDVEREIRAAERRGKPVRVAEAG